MRPPTPFEVCAQIVGEHGANALATLDEQRAGRLTARINKYGEALRELAGENGAQRGPSEAQAADGERPEIRG